eukprot:m.333582 g.333582  ORF g.333582 m.333582 type:complete len:201 (-) comp55651_c0_seq4:1617-2219(-)
MSLLRGVFWSVRAQTAIRALATGVQVRPQPTPGQSADRPKKLARNNRSEQVAGILLQAQAERPVAAKQLLDSLASHTILNFNPLINANSALDPKVKRLFDLRNASTAEVRKVATQEMIQKLQKKEFDTGSTDVQIGVLTVRIAGLHEHLLTNTKDFCSKRQLQLAVTQRRKLLQYLKRKNFARYCEILHTLQLRPVQGLR